MNSSKISVDVRPVSFQLSLHQNVLSPKMVHTSSLPKPSRSAQWILDKRALSEVNCESTNFYRPMKHLKLKQWNLTEPISPFSCPDWWSETAPARRDLAAFQAALSCCQFLFLFILGIGRVDSSCCRVGSPPGRRVLI